MISYHSLLKHSDMLWLTEMCEVQFKCSLFFVCLAQMKAGYIKL